MIEIGYARVYAREASPVGLKPCLMPFKPLRRAEALPYAIQALRAQPHRIDGLRWH